MKLEDYLSKYGLSDAAFAKRIGVAVSSVWRIRTNRVRPDWPMMEKISAATDGAVNPNDFLPDSSRQSQPERAA